MKQRLGLAGCLLRPRDLLILDEPTNGLDPQGTREVRNLIRDLAADGTTVLVSSHLLAEIEQIATHVGIMSLGRLVRQGPLSEVLAATSSLVTVRTSDVDRAAKVVMARGLAVTELHADSLVLHLDGAAPEDVNADLVRSGVPVRGFSVERPALEDLFVEITGEGFDGVR
jgi:ABC-2 type transport system ATP-binding protein